MAENVERELAEEIKAGLPLDSGTIEPLTDPLPIVRWLVIGLLGNMRLLCQAMRAKRTLPPADYQAFRELVDQLDAHLGRWKPK